MTDSVDGKYIFIGLPCGLVALDALAQNFLGSWEEEGAEVTYIQSYNGKIVCRSPLPNGKIVCRSPLLPLPPKNPGNSVRGHLMLPVHKVNQ